MHAGAQMGGYRIVEKLGSGGMGSVWLAEHVMLGRRAALKLLHPDLSTRRDIVRRFFNEARAATAIRDPGIVQIFDFGYHDDGSAYIIMELLDGETLESRLRRIGSFEVHDALRLMRQVASALGAAHNCGIIHRDLKPENIFVIRDPEVAGGERAKILDFGIAKLMDEYQSVSTPTGMMGTPLYMSPEQCIGQGAVDQRADVYALGCVLFELLVGRPPFDGGPVALLDKHMNEPPPVPSSCKPNMPPAIDALVLRCLAKHRDQRFENAGELAREIASVLVALGRGSGPVTTSIAVANFDELAVTLREKAMSGGMTVPDAPSERDEAATTTPAPPSARARTPTASVRPARRGPVIAIATGALTLGVVGLVIWRVLDQPPPPKLVEPPKPVEQPKPVESPKPAEPPPAPDPRVQLTSVMADLLGKFVAWSQDHAGAPCPDLAALGGAPTDPWGHSLALTCTDQPHNQIVGAISAGPDGKMGTADDIGSWQLGREVTDLVHGAPWHPRIATTSRKVRTHPNTKVDAHSEEPKLDLDENGVPIER